MSTATTNGTTTAPATPEPGQTITWKDLDGVTRTGEVASVRATGTMKATSDGKLYTVMPGQLVTPGAEPPGPDGGGEGAGATAAPLPQGEAATASEPLVIHVPKSAVGHFWEEPPAGSEEFWAFKDRPAVEPGALILFKIGGELVADAVVGRVEEPGQTKCEGTGKFKDRWKVYWPPESFRDLRPVLEWKPVDVSSEDLEAVGHGGAIFRVEELASDEGWEAGVAREGVGDGTIIMEPAPWSTRAEAMERCEEMNRELAAAGRIAGDPPPDAVIFNPGSATPAPAPATVPVGSAGPDNDVPDPDTWHQIQEARRDERAAEDRVDELSEDLKAAKKELEKASAKLGMLIDAAKYPTLFSGRKPAPSNVAAEPPAPTAEKPAPTAEKPADDGGKVDPDAWKADDIAVLKLPAKHETKVRDAGISTLGPFEAWRASRFETPKVKGIGEKAREEIDEAAVAYWMAKGQPAAETPAQDESAPAPLTWQDTETDGQVAADNTAGVLTDENEPAQFVITREGEEYGLDLSSDFLMPSKGPGTFTTLEKAKAWAEERNREIHADRGQTVAGVVAAQDAAAAEPPKKARKKREPEPATA